MNQSIQITFKVLGQRRKERNPSVFGSSCRLSTTRDESPVVYGPYFIAEVKQSSEYQTLSFLSLSARVSNPHLQF